MDKTLKISTSIDLDVPSNKVWFALTDTEMIKQYLWGTETATDWKVGSPIIFSGKWGETTFEDKGFILEVEKEKLFKYNYWSSFWGENSNTDDYCIITYELSEHGSQTRLTVSQEGFKDVQSRDHTLENWNGVLNSLKNLLEK